MVGYYWKQISYIWLYPADRTNMRRTFAQRFQNNDARIVKLWKVAEKEGEKLDCGKRVNCCERKNFVILLMMYFLVCLLFRTDILHANVKWAYTINSLASEIWLYNEGVKASNNRPNTEFQYGKQNFKDRERESMWFCK